MFARRSAVAPCPSCDVELPAERTRMANPSCSACGTELTPVRIARSAQRLAAFSVDAALLTATALPINLGLVALGSDAPLRLDLDGLLTALASSPLTQAAAVSPTIAMTSLYFMATLMVGGRSPGQIVCRTRLVDEQGRLPSLTSLAVRTLAWWVGLVPVGLGSIWLAFDDQRRALHDHVARTYVLEDS